MDIVFNLSSFDLKRTKEELFQNNRQMKNIAELSSDIDSLNESVWISKYEFIERMGGFRYHLVDKVSVMLDYFGEKIERDTLSEEKDTEKTTLTISDSIAEVQMEATAACNSRRYPRAVFAHGGPECGHRSIGNHQNHQRQITEITKITT